MFNRIMSAGFQQVIETDNVRFDVHVRVIDAIADTRLSRKIYYDVKVISIEELIDQCLITDGTFDEHMLHQG